MEFENILGYCKYFDKGKRAFYCFKPTQGERGFCKVKGIKFNYFNENRYLYNGDLVLIKKGKFTFPAILEFTPFFKWILYSDLRGYFYECQIKDLIDFKLPGYILGKRIINKVYLNHDSPRQYDGATFETELKLAQFNADEYLKKYHPNLPENFNPFDPSNYQN